MEFPSIFKSKVDKNIENDANYLEKIKSDESSSIHSNYSNKSQIKYKENYEQVLDDLISNDSKELENNKTKSSKITKIKPSKKTTKTTKKSKK